MSQYEDLLRERAQPFLACLEQEGFDASLFGASDYSIKVSLRRDAQKHGPVLIYYSPKRDEFTVKGHEMRTKDLFSLVERLFQQSASTDESDDEALTGVHVYVDGSCMDGHVGYGVVAYVDGQVRHEAHGTVSDPGTTRQVAGELKATMEALQWCQTEGIDAVHLHYDLEGIKNWATGAWRAKNPITKNYVDFISECPVEVTWVDEDAHTGVTGNERADRLAKKGAAEGKQEAASDASNPMEELRACVDSFLEHLDKTLDDPAFTVSFDGIQNDQYARLNVLIDGERKGIIDIYNTANKHLEPRFHAFQNSSCRERLEVCWSQHTDPTPSPEENIIQQAEHYHTIYAPYREASRLDFSPFAEALERAYDVIEETDVSLDRHSHDFDVLERYFHDLQQKG